MHFPIILASSSPRRIELLGDLKVPFTVVPSHFDEESLPFGGDPAGYVCQLAESKGAVVAAKHPGALVISADTLAFIDNQPVGKPADSDEARAYLLRFAGRWHSIHTGVTVHWQGMAHTQAEETRVLCNHLSERHIDAFVASGEWRGKSGGYTIQRWGGLIIAKIEGCCYNVAGLPLNTLQILFKRCDCDLWNYIGHFLDCQ